MNENMAGLWLYGLLSNIVFLFREIILQTLIKRKIYQKFEWERNPTQKRVQLKKKFLGMRIAKKKRKQVFSLGWHEPLMMAKDTGWLYIMLICFSTDCKIAFWSGRSLKDIKDSAKGSSFFRLVIFFC